LHEPLELVGPLAANAPRCFNRVAQALELCERRLLVEPLARLVCVHQRS
jgi:hypothetical protein